MNLETAIRTAIDMEKKIEAVYAEAAHKSDSETGKRVFGLLAKEEASHVAYLASRLEKWTADGSLELERLATDLPTAERIGQLQAAATQKLKEPGTAGEREMMERALALEVSTSGFYKQMVDELDGEGRALFARFLEIEEGHVKLAQAELDNLEGAGFWFYAPGFPVENA